jgi:tetraacyldisaccharide 4'-kinase
MKNIMLYLEKIINGEKEGFTASAVCFLLIILSSIYSLLAKFRYRLYKNNILKQKEAEVPVISIGNITTGGTGKTPFTAFLLDNLKDKYRTAVISRGYGAAENVEEPFLIKDGREIFKGSKLAQRERAELILLDDGFQHYQLKRDLDVVILDAEDPFSNGRVLPAGYLREPCTALKRADIFLINRSENIDFNKIQEIRKSLNTLSPDNKGVFAAETVLEKCISIADQAEKDADFLKDKKVFAFSGIGSPEAFKNSIKNAGGEVVSYRVFEDHYNYKKEDILTLLDQYESSNANLILTTEKDAVKLFDFAEIIGELPFYYLTISMKIDDNEKLMKVIKEKIQTKI